jgi:hypothetical protein
MQDLLRFAPQAHAAGVKRMTAFGTLAPDCSKGAIRP